MDSLDLDELERLARDAKGSIHASNLALCAICGYDRALRNAAPELLQRARGYDLMREALIEIEAQVEGYIDGAPDAGPCAALASEVYNTAEEALARTKAPATPRATPRTGRFCADCLGGIEGYVYARMTVDGPDDLVCQDCAATTDDEKAQQGP